MSNATKAPASAKKTVAAAKAAPGTKADIVDVLIARDANLSKKDALEIVTAVFDAVLSVAKSKRKIAIHGFGAFQIKDVAARIGRNVKTGDSLQIPAKRKFTLSVSKTVKDAL